MASLLILLLVAPALAQPADCPAVPVGPPMDVEIRVGVNKNTTAPATAKLGLTHLPAYGSLCEAAPPPTGDVLRGTPEPHDLLRGNATGDILSGAPAGEVVIGPARPVPLPR